MASNIAISLFLITFVVATADCNFYQDFDIYWGDERTKFLDNGELLTLSLDVASGSGIHTKNEYLFGKFDIQIKLVPGNSAGTITTFYLLSADEATRDEVDFEFLGNISGEPYIVHTNVYIKGEGHREQEFYLWFDPTEDFHTYSLTWSNLSIIFSVDGTPIREFKNLESFGVPFPKYQTMRVLCTIWDGEDWATRGGLVRTDWSQAPFTATFKNYTAQACVWNSDSDSSSCYTWVTQTLDAAKEAKIQWVQKNYMIYNYCADTRVMEQGLPPECLQY